MPGYVLDSYAMLAYFRKEAGGEIVEKILLEAAAGKHELFMACINAGEIFYMAYRKDGADKAALVWKALQQFPIKITDADLQFTHKAAYIKARYSLSFADAFAAALAINKKAVLLTGDTEFNNLINEAGFKVKYL